MRKWALVKDGYVVQTFDTDLPDQSVGVGGEWILVHDSPVSHGYAYDPQANLFIPPQMYPSWVLNSNNVWEAPIPKPGEHYTWNESLVQWVAVEPS